MIKIPIDNLPPEDQVFVRAKLKKLDDTTLSGYNVGENSMFRECPAI